MVDEIFSFSELGFQEVETSAYVTGVLEKNGFTVTRGVAGMPTAFVASWGSGKPVIGFMADIDGLKSIKLANVKNKGDMKIAFADGTLEMHCAYALRTDGMFSDGEIRQLLIKSL